MLELPDDVTSKDKRFNPFSLDALNFLLADVRGALGHYLNVFLVTQRHWSQTEVGLVTTLGGLLGLAAQTPIGGIIDATPAKRGVIVLALASSLVVPRWWHSLFLRRKCQKLSNEDRLKRL